MPIFLHIGNTGGATISEVIENQYNIDNLFNTSSAYDKGEENLKAEFKKILDKKENEIKCVYGRIPFGLHKLFPKNCTYFTMMREPIEQVISFYHWRIDHPEDPICRQFIQRYSTLGDYVDKSDNHQTRMILGEYKRKLTQEDLLLAKQIINTHFALVGITEMIDEPLFLMKHIFNWKNSIFHRKLCVNKKRPCKDELSNMLIQKIKQQNKYDYELYSFAKQSLIKKIDSLEYRKKLELKEFIFKNQNINKFMIKDEWSGIKNSFFEFLEQNCQMKVLVFGTGNGGQLIYDIINTFNSEFDYKINIEGFLDNNSSKWNKKFLLKYIYKPSLEIVKDVDYIIIASSWSEEIRKNLLNMSIIDEKIIISY